MSLKKHYEFELTAKLNELNEEERKIVNQYMEDDAGVDLVSFFDEQHPSTDEEACQEIQFLLEALSELSKYEFAMKELAEIKVALATLKSVI